MWFELKSLNIALPVVLAILVLMLTISLMINSVDMWVLWSKLGDEELYMVMVVVLYFLLPKVQQGLVLVLAVLLSGSLSIVLKYTFNVPRPPDPLVEVSGPSFPSGHAQVSSSFWSALSFMTMKKLVAIISAIVVLGVSASRIFLRAHYGIDVVSGALVGLMVGYASYYALAHYLKRGSHMVYHVNAGITTAMSVYSMIVLNAELNSLTTILGLSLAILTILLVARNGFARLSSSSTIARFIASLVSVVLLLSIHLVTKSFAPFIRLACFYVTGLCVFATPLILRSPSRGRFELIKCRSRFNVP